MPKRCQEEPGDLQRFFRVYFKADFIEANSSYEEELQAFFFPSTVFSFRHRFSFFPKPPTAYNPFFCSEERLTLEMSNFLSYGDNFTFSTCLIPSFRVSLAQPRGTKVSHQNKPVFDMTLCLILEDTQQRADIVCCLWFFRGHTKYLLRLFLC